MLLKYDRHHKNCVRHLSDVGQTSGGHLVNKNTISYIDDLVTSKRWNFY